MQLRSLSASLHWWSCLVVLISVLVLKPNHVDSIAVMSVDLGSEWMKVAIVSPGVPMEIALNKESKRKTPVSIAFRHDERLFGEDAHSVGVRFPKLSYNYLLELLGKPVSHPQVKLFQSRFPYYDIIPDPERGTVVFRHEGETQYTPEELVGMLLQKAKEFAQNSANQAINELVITVPGYFNQAERKAVLQAADLAGLKVLQLMNDYTAVALNYGIFRRKDFNETAHYVMFYDMGASSTTATIVSYQLVKVKDKGVTETHPQVQILGVGYDRTLGGLEMQIRLRDYLGKKFNEMKKTSNDVFKNPRAMAKLFKEAGRVKTVLSANTDHYAQVEGLLDEKDFKLQVTREEFEKLCADLSGRVKSPIEQALKTSSLTMDLISHVVLVGAGTRVPFVQDELVKTVKMELSKNLNTDEAAVMGAVYKAADLSTGFKVKKFITRDAVLFPIQNVVFERDNDGSIRQVKRMLFGPMNPYPQKKILTFNKHQADFNFNVNYAELDHLNPLEIESIGNLNLMQVDLKGVAEAHAKHQGDNVESKGIKAHFTLDESGILSLSGVELVLEKLVTAEDEAAQEESTLSKLGSTFSKLFTGPEEALKNAGEKPVKEDSESKEETGDKKEDGEGDQQKKEGAGEGTAEEVKRNETAKDGDKKKPKVVVVKESINTVEKIIGVPPLGDKQFQELVKKIEVLNLNDELKRRREGAMNALESFVFDVKIKLEEEPYLAAATEAEAEAIRNVCSQIFKWMDDEGINADTAAYEAKLAELKTVTRPVWRRVKEHEERPDALGALDSTLNGSIKFLNHIKNLTANATAPDESIFTPVEIELLEKTINETKDWKKKITEEQAHLKLSDNPKLTVKTLIEKMNVLDREVKYLVNKAKIWRPKKKEEPAGKEVPNANDTSKKQQETPVEEEKQVPDDSPNIDEFIKPVKEETVKPSSKSDARGKKEESSRKEESTKDDGGTKEEVPSLPEPAVKPQPEPSKTDKEDVHTEL